MKSIYLFLSLGVILLLLSSGCDSPKVINDLSDTSYQLVNQDSAKVSFPDDFQGKPLIAGYIFTNCNGMCPMITANMKEISKQLSENQEVQFVGITFDPMRDKPNDLRQYMQKFGLDESRFTYLTGDSATVYSLLEDIGIRAQILPDTTAGHNYQFKHTNQINLIDRQGRIRMEYVGSVVPPEIVVEDFKKLE